MSQNSYDGYERELTREERAEIRRLVTERCANYDNTSRTCLPLDGSCYMLDKWWTGAFCRYFRDAILPTEPTLKALWTDNQISSQYKRCSMCGKPFLPITKQTYCSDACRVAARRMSERARKRRVRRNKG